jgi:dGTP triphosphohydrolase
VTVIRQVGKSPASNGPATESPESLDQVRDILFGGQMRMVDARLQALETRLQQEQVSLREEFSREVADLDDTVKKGITQLSERLTAERAKRAEELKSLSSDMKELVKNLERRHQALEEAASQADAELRDNLFRQSASQSADLAKTADRLAKQIDDVTTTLRGDKVDTATLASGLSELANRLTSNGNAHSPKRATKG